MRTGKLAEHESPLACHVVTRVSKKVLSLPLALCRLQQVGELGPGSQEWESWSCSLLAAAHRRARADTVSGLGNTLELTLFTGVQVIGTCGHKSRRTALSPLPLKARGGKRKENMPFSHPLPPVTDERASLGDMRTEELALSLTKYNPESGLCTLPGQNSRADSAL